MSVQERRRKLIQAEWIVFGAIMLLLLARGYASGAFFGDTLAEILVGWVVIFLILRVSIALVARMAVGLGGKWPKDMLVSSATTVVVVSLLIGFAVLIGMAMAELGLMMGPFENLSFGLFGPFLTFAIVLPIPFGVLIWWPLLFMIGSVVLWTERQLAV